MGLCLNGIGYYSDAVDAYVSALKMNYNTAQVHANLANVLVNIGEFDAAVLHFGQAVKINPSDRFLQQKMQSLQAFLEKCKTPEQCIRISIDQKPDNPALRFKLGMIYEKQGKPEQAFAVYDAILNEIGQSNRKLYQLVIARMVTLHAIKGETEQSLQLLRQGIETAPDNPYFYYEIAAFYGALGEIKQSVAWLDMAIKKGYQNRAQIRSDERLASIRHTQYFQNLIPGK
jgi:tetratricopeptide (TPR) repeat protein